MVISACAEPLAVVRSCEYPFSLPKELVANRVTVLGFLADQILLTSTVRDYIVDEGRVPHEEHCRVCHRGGEMLMCDTCPAVYHLGCLGISEVRRINRTSVLLSRV